MSQIQIIEKVSGTVKVIAQKRILISTLARIKQRVRKELKIKSLDLYDGVTRDGICGSIEQNKFFGSYAPPVVMEVNVNMRQQEVRIEVYEQGKKMYQIIKEEFIAAAEESKIEKLVMVKVFE